MNKSTTRISYTTAVGAACAMLTVLLLGLLLNAAFSVQAFA
jgi:hypothetical protein